MLLLLLFSMWFWSGFTQDGYMTLSLDDSKASATTNYIFDILQQIEVDIEANSLIRITFPIQYQGIMTDGAYSCYAAVWVENVAIPTVSCSVSGLTLTISDGFPSAVTAPYLTIYTLIIEGVLNPLYAETTQSFNGQIQSPSSSVLFSFQTNYGAYGVTITEGVMECSISSSPTPTSQSSAMIISITPTSMIPYNTSITLSMDKYWPTNAVNITPILEQPITCLPITNTSNTITCSYSVTSSLIIVKLTNLVDADTTSPIQFSISSIINPPTTQPQGSIQLLSKKDDSKTIQRCTGNKLTGTTTNSLMNIVYSVEDMEVNAQSKGYLSFKINNIVISTDTIIVAFPSQLELTALSWVFVVNGLINDTSPTVIGNQLEISGVSATAEETIEIQLSQIINSNSEATTSSFSIVLMRLSYPMEELTTNLVFTARRGIIDGSVTLTTYSIGMVTNYTFNIQLSNPITTTSLLYIEWPILYDTIIDSNISCVPACSVDADYLTFTSLSGLAHTLTIVDVANPITVGQTSSFTVYTQLDPADTSSIVDESNATFTVTLTSRQLSSITVVSSSDVVYNYPTTFTITPTNDVDLPPFSYLVVGVPESIVVDSGTLVCLYGSASISCTFDSNTRQITVSVISQDTILAGAISPLYIHNLQNPPSTQPTQSFTFTIINSFSQTLQHKTSGLTYNCGTATTFSTLSMIPNNTLNSASTSLTIAYSLKMPHINETLLILTFPAEFDVQATTCSAVSANLEAIACSKSANVVKVVLTFVSVASAEVSFRVEGYENYPSLEPYTVNCHLYESISEAFSICDEDIQLVNNQLSQITVHSYQFSAPTLASTSTLALSLTPTSADFASLTITLPDEFTIDAQSYTLPSDLQASLSVRTYTLTPLVLGSVSMPIILTLKQLTTPDYTPSSQIIIQTYSSTAYRMSTDSSVIFSTQCTLPCRQCAAADPISCTDCYDDELLVSGMTILDGSQCKAVCGNGQYAHNVTGQCEECSSTCELCIDYSVCTTCPTDTYLLEYTCLNQCPFGYYSYINRCQACTPTLNCQSCNTSYDCLTCAQNYYLYDSQCYSSCPSLITYEDDIKRQCVACPETCTKCTGNYSDVVCSECVSGYLLDSGGCYLECQTAGLVPEGQNCVGCASICLTCSASPYNCDTCDPFSSTPYFHNNLCLSLCPSGYYASNSTYTCQTCQSPCEICTSLSINSCQSCLEGYYLLDASCLQQCPAQYYENVHQCTPCVSPCKQCTTQLSCEKCVTGFYLYGDDCVSQCDPGMTIINGDECLVCDSECKTCATSTYCTSCYSSNYLYNGTCIVDCPAGTYPSSSTQSCQLCLSPCDECSSDSYCDTCINSALFIQNGQCVASCTSPLIGVNSLCVSCSSQCATCETSIDNCVLCASGYYYFEDDSSCQSSCGLLVWDDGDNQVCVSECPSGMYNNIGICSACASECSSCTDGSSCEVCDGGYYLYEGICYSSCPAEAPYPDSSSCDMCNKTYCSACQSLQNCQSCIDGYLLINNSTKSCISSCPTDQQYNADTLSCEDKQTQTPTSTPLPQYLFLIIGSGLLLIVLISRVQYSSTNLIMCAYMVIGCMSTCSLGYLAYYQISQIIQNQTITHISTYVLLGVMGVHVLGVFFGVFGLVCCVMDHSLKEFFQEHPIVGAFVLLLSVGEYRFMWIVHSGFFGAEIFMVKFSKNAAVVLSKSVLVLSLIGSLGLAGYGVYSLMISDGTISRLLLTTTSIASMPDHMYIQLIVLGSLMILLSIGMLLIKAENYELQSVQYKDVEQITRNQNNQSLNELNERSALDKRFNESEMIEQEKMDLHDFGLTNQKTGTITLLGSQRPKTSISTMRNKQVDSNIQVDMGTLLLPQLDEESQIIQQEEIPTKNEQNQQIKSQKKQQNLQEAEKLEANSQIKIHVSDQIQQNTQNINIFVPEESENDHLSYKQITQMNQSIPDQFKPIQDKTQKTQSDAYEEYNIDQQGTSVIEQNVPSIFVYEDQSENIEEQSLGVNDEKLSEKQENQNNQNEKEENLEYKNEKVKEQSQNQNQEDRGEQNFDEKVETEKQDGNDYKEDEGENNESDKREIFIFKEAEESKNEQNANQSIFTENNSQKMNKDHINQSKQKEEHVLNQKIESSMSHEVNKSKNQTAKNEGGMRFSQIKDPTELLSKLRGKKKEKIQKSPQKQIKNQYSEEEINPVIQNSSKSLRIQKSSSDIKNNLESQQKIAIETTKIQKQKQNGEKMKPSRYPPTQIQINRRKKHNPSSRRKASFEEQFESPEIESGFFNFSNKQYSMHSQQNNVLKGNNQLYQKPFSQGVDQQQSQDIQFEKKNQKCQENVQNQEIFKTVSNYDEQILIDNEERQKQLQSEKYVEQNLPSIDSFSRRQLLSQHQNTQKQIDSDKSYRSVRDKTPIELIQSKQKNYRQSQNSLSQRQKDFAIQNLHQKDKKQLKIEKNISQYSKISSKPEENIRVIQQKSQQSRNETQGRARKSKVSSQSSMRRKVSQSEQGNKSQRSQLQSKQNYEQNINIPIRQLSHQSRTVRTMTERTSKKSKVQQNQQQKRGEKSLHTEQRSAYLNEEQNQLELKVRIPNKSAEETQKKELLLQKSKQIEESRVMGASTVVLKEIDEIEKVQKKSDKPLLSKRTNNEKIQIIDKYSQHQKNYPKDEYKSQLDDAEKFNQCRREFGNQKKQAQKGNQISQIFTQNVLIVEEDDHQLNEKSEKSKEENGKQKIQHIEEEKNKGITFIEDMDQLDEMVKTPPRRKIDSFPDDEINETKPSQYLLKGSKKRRQKINQMRPPNIPHRKANIPVSHNFKKKNIRYEQSDTFYEQTDQSLKKRKYTTEVQDEKPSVLLRGSFKKIGEIILNDTIHEGSDH